MFRQSYRCNKTTDRQRYCPQTCESAGYLHEVEPCNLLFTILTNRIFGLITFLQTCVHMQWIPDVRIIRCNNSGLHEVGFYCFRSKKNYTRDVTKVTATLLQNEHSVSKNFQQILIYRVQ